jgi:hypothetical protein
MDKEKTKVIFRRWLNGSVIALFPEIATDTLGYYCQSYMHVGQHGPSCPTLVSSTKPASKEEYQALFDELTKLGYNLEIIKRFRYSHQQTRKEMYK